MSLYTVYPNPLLFFHQEVEARKEVAPKAEEEGAESSSSEANGPVGASAPSSNRAVRGGRGSEAGRWFRKLLESV